MHANATDALERAICIRINALLAHVCAHVCNTNPQYISNIILLNTYMVFHVGASVWCNSAIFCPQEGLQDCSKPPDSVPPLSPIYLVVTCWFIRSIAHVTILPVHTPELCALCCFTWIYHKKGHVSAHILPPLLFFHQCLTISSLFLTHSWNHYLFSFLSQRTRAFLVKSFAHYLLFFILPLAQLWFFCYPPTSSLFLDHCLSSCSSLGISLPTSLLLCLLCPPDVIETAV